MMFSKEVYTIRLILWNAGNGYVICVRLTFCAKRLADIFAPACAAGNIGINCFLRTF